MIPVLFPLFFLSSGMLVLGLLRLAGCRFVHRGEELYFAAAGGLAWMSFGAVTLGLVGLARFGPLFAAALGTGAAGAGLFWAARREAAPPPVPRLRGYAPLAAVLAWLPLSFLPPFFYDTLRYHYALPEVFLRTGFTYPLPHFVESSYPLGGEMLAMIGMADASYVGANLATLLVFALCGLGILCLADRLGDRRAGWAALLLFLSSSTAVHTVFYAKTDLVVTLFFLAAVHALLVYRREGDRRFLVLAAALAGAFLGTKYTAGLFAALALALALAGRARAEGARLPALARDAGLFVLVALAMFTPWLYRNVAATGNPVYPLLNGVFHGPGWTEARMKILFEDSHPPALWLHGAGDLVRLLRSATFFPDVSLSGAGASLGAALAGALLFPIAVRRPDPSWRFLALLSLLAGVAWLLASSFSRYLLPALPLMALLSGAALSRFSSRGGRPVSAAAAAILVAALLAQAGSAAAESTVFRAWRGAFALAGRPDRADVIAARFDPSLGAARFANERLPATSRILFLGETRLYRVHRDAVAPSPFDAHPLEAAVSVADADDRRVREALAAQGITHVLVNWADWERLGRTYYRRHWSPGAVERADRFVRTLPAVYGDRAVTIFELADRAGA